MSNRTKTSEASGTNTNEKDEKENKWKKFTKGDDRAALIQLIQTVPKDILPVIKNSVLGSISMNDIPKYLIKLPRKLNLIYFLVLEPKYFKLEWVANKDLTFNKKSYKSKDTIRLENEKDKLLLAKVGKTSIKLVLENSNKKDKVYVSMTYNGKTHRIEFSSDIPTDQLLVKIAEYGVSKFWLRPDAIMSSLAKHFYKEESEGHKYQYKLLYFVAEPADNAVEVEKTLRTKLSYSGNWIAKEAIFEWLCGPVTSLWRFIGPSEWIVTSRYIVKRFKQSEVQSSLYGTASELQFFDENSKPIGGKFQKHCHSNNFCLRFTAKEKR